MFGNLGTAEAAVSLLINAVGRAPPDVIIVDWNMGAEPRLRAPARPELVPTRGNLPGDNRALAPS